MAYLFLDCATQASGICKALFLLSVYWYELEAKLFFVEYF